MRDTKQTNSQPTAIAPTTLASVIKINRRSAFRTGRSKQPPPAIEATGLASVITINSRSAFRAAEPKLAQRPFDVDAVLERELKRFNAAIPTYFTAGG